jgi:hypothetical protein
MDCEDWVSTDSLLPVSGGWQCSPIQGFLMLMAHGRGSAEQSAGERAPTKQTVHPSRQT